MSVKRRLTDSEAEIIPYRTPQGFEPALGNDLSEFEEEVQAKFEESGLGRRGMRPPERLPQHRDYGTQLACEFDKRVFEQRPGLNYFVRATVPGEYHPEIENLGVTAALVMQLGPGKRIRQPLRLYGVSLDEPGAVTLPPDPNSGARTVKLHYMAMKWKLGY